MKTQEIQTYNEVDLQKDIVLSYLDKERDTWLAARALADRAVCLDARLNGERDKSMRMIDAMLDELIELPGVRYE